MKIIDSDLFKTRIIIDDIMNKFNQYIINDRIIIIADSNVMKLYPKLFLDYRCIIIHSSESTKTIETINYIYEKLLDLNADKHTFLLGIGGGVITDLVGYAATTFMRGLKFGFMPTTLLAMADAAIGGKNGINFAGYKNIIGCVSQPEIILTDVRFLNTLNEKDIYSGFSEIIKIAILLDRDLLNFLNVNNKLLLKLEKKELLHALENVVKLKLSIVEKDQYDYGLRRLLNFGHTFGHAIEAEYGESLFISHGEAVAMGMVVAMRLSVLEGKLDKGILEQSEQLIGKYHLPNTVNLDCKLLINKIKKDKKRDQKKVNMILLEDFARPYIKQFDLCDLESKCHDIFNF